MLFVYGVLLTKREGRAPEVTVKKSTRFDELENICFGWLYHYVPTIDSLKNPVTLYL